MIITAQSIPHVNPLAGSSGNAAGAYFITASSLLYPVGGTLISVSGCDREFAHCSHSMALGPVDRQHTPRTAEPRNT